MKTTIIGFPRIGEQRELKFATEKYWKGEITEAELLETAGQIRKKNWVLQKDSGIDMIPSGDFSHYDGILDTAFTFNIIPKRYRDLDLSDLDTYFAMARGYQGKNGDVKALPMKKWFNTNYHYIVPEIDDETKIVLSDSRIRDAHKEAKDIGIETKSVVSGPFTLLKLSRYTGNKKAGDFAKVLAEEYVKLFKELSEEGVSLVQIDEPYLVRDLDKSDIDLFKGLYLTILKEKGDLKILLQTYFGDVRDIYKTVTEMDFDMIGLDLIEGKKNTELILKEGFPKGKVLVAGLVNGKNIWRNRYKDTLSVIRDLKDKGIDVVLGTSCSLLHVPYTVRNEEKLSKEYTEHFAFAEEKLTELSEIAYLSDIEGRENLKSDEIDLRNRKLFLNRPDVEREDVQRRVNEITEDDYRRKPSFEEREKIQKDNLKLPLFPTTTIGSFPQTPEIRKQRRLFKNKEIGLQEYISFIRSKISECIKLQEEIGLDVLVHGEFERNDMVEYFGEHLDGFLFTEFAWVQSYGMRCVKPPVIWGDVKRRTPITVEWSSFAQSLTDHPVKGMLTGPVTILNWSFPREDITIKESILQIALAIRDEVLDLEKNGIKIIQIDEAALREKLPLRKSDWYPEYLDFAIPAFRLVHSKVKPETQIHTHMCYSEFTDIIPAIDDMDADVITFEASRSDLQILDSLKENDFRTEVGPGVYDIHSPRVPGKEEIISALEKMLKRVDVSKLWVNPDCGLKTRGDEETKASLINLTKAAKTLRERAAF